MTFSKSTKCQDEMRLTQVSTIAPTDVQTEATQTTEPSQQGLLQSTTTSTHMTNYESTKCQNQIRLTQLVVSASQ